MPALTQLLYITQPHINCTKLLKATLQAIINVCSCYIYRGFNLFFLWRSVHVNITKMSSSSKVSLMLFLYVFMSVLISALAGNFYRDFDILFGDRRAVIRNGGQILTLSLDKASGSGIRSKNEYLFGRVDMQIKLVNGNSAGTVTTYYVSMQLFFHFACHF